MSAEQDQDAARLDYLSSENLPEFCEQADGFDAGWNAALAQRQPPPGPGLSPGERAQIVNTSGRGALQLRLLALYDAAEARAQAAEQQLALVKAVARDTLPDVKALRAKLSQVTGDLERINANAQNALGLLR